MGTTRDTSSLWRLRKVISAADIERAIDVNMARIAFSGTLGGHGCTMITTRPDISIKIAIGSRKALIPGILRDNRWLSIILTAAPSNAANNAVFVQFIDAVLFHGNRRKKEYYTTADVIEISGSTQGT